MVNIFDFNLSNWKSFDFISCHIRSRLAECRHPGTRFQTRTFESRGKHSDVHLIVTCIVVGGRGMKQPVRMTHNVQFYLNRNK